MIRRIFSVPALTPLLTLLFGFSSLVVAVGGELAFPTRPPAHVDLVLDAVQLFTLESPADRDAQTWRVARVLAALAIGLGLIEIVRRVLPDVRREFGLLGVDARLWVGRRHVVVAGLGQLGFELVQGLLDRRPRRVVVAIERDETAWQIAAARARGAVVIVGDARDENVLAEARAIGAAEVYCTSDLDSTNLEVVSQLATLVARRGHVPECFASLSSQGMVDAVRRSPLIQGVHPLVLRPFDIHESRARALVTRELVQHTPRADQVAHYVLVGFGTLARTFAREAGKLAHFGNRRRLRLTIVAPFSTEPYRSERRRFLTLYPGFCPDPSDFSIEALVRGEGDVDAWSNRTFRPQDSTRRSDDPRAIEYAVNAEFLDSGLAGLFGDVLDQIRTRLQRPEVAPCIVVCDDHARSNVENGMRLHHALASVGIQAPVFLYLAEEPGLVKVLDQAGGLQAFGPVEAKDLVEEVRLPSSENIARAYHKAYAERTSKSGSASASADDSGWDELSHDLRRSNQEAAAHVDVKLHEVGLARRDRPRREKRGAPAKVSAFSAGQLELLAQIEHNRWVAERLIAGWRFGPRSDDDRTRPSIVPWSALPSSEGAKDYTQIEAIIPAIERAGQGVYLR